MTFAHAAARLAGMAALAGLVLLVSRADCAKAAGDTGRPRPTGASSPIDATRLPPPGSYRLPRLLVAPDGEVVSSDGRAHRLHRLLAGRLSVVSFMYTYCRDPEGCPLAWRALENVRRALQDDHKLAPQAQLVSLSFDPSNDTPAQMALFGGARANDPRVRWLFLTTSSVSRLLPLLEGFGQDVTVETDERGRPTRTLNHLMKIFLVDARLQVREIYSVATLAPEAIVNDLRTLQMEAGAARTP